ncbi:MAG: (d)CMP kinase [Chloroflexi bacterium]|nr:(d)CMP kinase [Chloroflexota bacterium]
MRVTPPPTIAIDGPGASGKNTVGLLLAQRLGYRLVDTGAMYRALTWLALATGLDFDDPEALTGFAEATPLRVLPSSAQHPQGGLYADGEDLTPKLHLPEVDAKVSELSRVPGVRRVLVAQQRRLAAEGGVVMVGRDIGAVVLPDAALKVYLDASPQERARRRHQQLRADGADVAYQAVLEDLRHRDTLDQEREASPLRPAPDARIINTERLTPQQVVDAILQHATAS